MKGSSKFYKNGKKTCKNGVPPSKLASKEYFKTSLGFPRMDESIVMLGVV